MAVDGSPPRPRTGSSTSSATSSPPDVIAVQFARPTSFGGIDGAPVPATDAATAIATLQANDGLTVLETSPAPMAGRVGSGTTLDHGGNGDDFRAVLEVAAGPISIGPGRRLWLGLFDLGDAAGDGLVAVLVGARSPAGLKPSRRPRRSSAPSPSGRASPHLDLHRR